MPRGAEGLVRVLDGEARLWIRSQGTFQGMPLDQALEIAELVDQGVVLDSPVTAWVVADRVATTGSMAIVSPRGSVQPDPGQPNTTGSNIAQCAVLHEAGVPVAVTCPSGRFGGASIGTGGILGQDLNTPHVDAAYAVRGGMPNREALRTLTLDAAKIAGVGDKMGSIEVGKDADLLILDGDPLDYKSFVITAVVNGRVVYQKASEPFYSHIQR